MALSDVSLRRKAVSGLGATADIGRRYGLDGSVAFDPSETLAVRLRCSAARDATKQKAPDDAGALHLIRSISDQYFATTGALPQSKR